MKATHILVIILLFALVFYGCRTGEVSNSPTPVNRLDSLAVVLDLVPVPTKEPSVPLEDEGLEAEMVALGIDSDNQINGKISAEDADAALVFGWSIGPIAVGSKKDEIFKQTYNKYKPRIDYIREKADKPIQVKSLNDLAKFKNLKELHIYFPIPPIDSLDLRNNNFLELFEIRDSQVRVVNFNSCSRIKEIHFWYSIYPLNLTRLERILISGCSELEELLYNGDPRTLDVSNNKELKQLHIAPRGNTYNLRIKELRLCNNTKLEVVNLEADNYESVYLPKLVHERFERGQNYYNESWRLNPLTLYMCASK